MSTTHVRKGDTVVVISGEEKGVRGRVLTVERDTSRVLVEGANMVTKHMKRGRMPNQQTGQRIKKEAPIAISNVALYCPKCERGVRSGVRRDEQGQKVRVCRKCGQDLPKPEMQKK